MSHQDYEPHDGRYPRSNRAEHFFPVGLRIIGDFAFLAVVLRSSMQVWNRMKSAGERDTVWYGGWIPVCCVWIAAVYRFAFIQYVRWHTRGTESPHSAKTRWYKLWSRGIKTFYPWMDWNWTSRLTPTENFIMAELMPPEDDDALMAPEDNAPLVAVPVQQVPNTSQSLIALARLFARKACTKQGLLYLWYAFQWLNAGALWYTYCGDGRVTNVDIVNGVAKTQNDTHQPSNDLWRIFGPLLENADFFVLSFYLQHAFIVMHLVWLHLGRYFAYIDTTRKAFHFAVGWETLQNILVLSFILPWDVGIYVTKYEITSYQGTLWFVLISAIGSLLCWASYADAKSGLLEKSSTVRDDVPLDHGCEVYGNTVSMRHLLNWVAMISLLCHHSYHADPKFMKAVFGGESGKDIFRHCGFGAATKSQLDAGSRPSHDKILAFNEFCKKECQWTYYNGSAAQKTPNERPAIKGPCGIGAGVQNMVLHPKVFEEGETACDSLNFLQQTARYDKDSGGHVSPNDDSAYEECKVLGVNAGHRVDEKLREKSNEAPFWYALLQIRRVECERTPLDRWRFWAQALRMVVSKGAVKPAGDMYEGMTRDEMGEAKLCYKALQQVAKQHENVCSRRTTVPQETVTKMKLVKDHAGLPAASVEFLNEDEPPNGDHMAYAFQCDDKTFFGDLAYHRLCISRIVCVIWVNRNPLDHNNAPRDLGRNFEIARDDGHLLMALAVLLLNSVAGTRAELYLLSEPGWTGHDALKQGSYLSDSDETKRQMFCDALRIEADDVVRLMSNWFVAFCFAGLAVASYTLFDMNDIGSSARYNRQLFWWNAQCLLRGFDRERLEFVLQSAAALCLPWPIRWQDPWDMGSLVFSVPCLLAFLACYLMRGPAHGVTVVDPMEITRDWVMDLAFPPAFYFGAFGDDPKMRNWSKCHLFFWWALQVFVSCYFVFPYKPVILEDEPSSTVWWFTTITTQTITRITEECCGTKHLWVFVRAILYGGVFNFLMVHGFLFVWDIAVCQEKVDEDGKIYYRPVRWSEKRWWWWKDQKTINDMVRKCHDNGQECPVPPPTRLVVTVAGVPSDLHAKKAKAAAAKARKGNGGASWKALLLLFQMPSSTTCWPTMHHEPWTLRSAGVFTICITYLKKFMGLAMIGVLSSTLWACCALTSSAPSRFAVQGGQLAGQAAGQLAGQQASQAAMQMMQAGPVAP